MELHGASLMFVIMGTGLRLQSTSQCSTAVVC